MLKNFTKCSIEGGMACLQYLFDQFKIINAEFCKINWIHQIDQLDCDQVYDFFMSSLIEVLSRSLPIFPTVNRKFKKPFRYPKYILKLQSVKRSSWRLWKEFRTPKLKSDYLQAAQAYRFNSIQFNTDICTRQLINYHVGAHDEQIISRKKVSFQFSFKTVQRKIRITQMHWECIPGCGRSKVESART